MGDPAEIARRLTEDERSVLEATPNDRVWRTAAYFVFSRRSLWSTKLLCVSLMKKRLFGGCVEAVTRANVYRLTPLGVAVREEVRKKEEKGGE